MADRVTENIFQYLLDAQARHKDVVIDESLPEDIQADLQFSEWMHAVDFSEESQLKNALRRTLEKQVHLVEHAEAIRHVDVVQPQPKPTKLSLAALIGLIVGGISMVVAAVLVIVHHQKNKLSEKSG